MLHRRFAALLLLPLILAAAPVFGQTVTVTIPEDDIDIDSFNGTIEDLPGPDGEVSFSEALIATNNTPGHQTIAFAIPQEIWIMQWLHPGKAVIYSSIGYYWRASDTVTIDGTTQTDYTGDTNPDGWEVLLEGSALSLNADHCTLIGFDSSVVGLSASHGEISGNTGWMQIDVYGGSDNLIHGNSGGTIKIDRASDNVVTGNTVTRVRVLGGGPAATGNRIGGPAEGDRNFITGYGTYNSEGMPAGTTIQLFDTVDTLIENNWIGTPDGLSQGNVAATIGVGFEGGNHGTVIRNNLISGILGHGIGPHHAGQFFGWGIHLSGATTDIRIVGNRIGLDINGEATLGSVNGINVGTWYGQQTLGVVIGGTGPGEGNVIAGHMLNGVTVGREAQQALISGNSIYDNGWLGIDLLTENGSYGVSQNDPLDADGGGNGQQNYPVIDTASFAGGLLSVSGALHSSPLDQFSLEFFASPECDDSGHGEGRRYLGALDLTTDSGGDALFDGQIAASLEAGWVLTATATHVADALSSEFSACAAVDILTAVETASVPPAARLGLPWPNPANPQLSVKLAIERAGFYRIRVVDAAGRMVKSLFEGEAPAGAMTLSWDGLDESHRASASGLYIIELSGAASATRKFTLLR